MRTDFKYDLALLVVVLIWGVNFPLIKSVLDRVGPLAFNAGRFTLSVAILGLWLWIRERDSFVQLRASTYPLLKVVGLGLLGHLLYQALFIVGLDNTTAGNSAFLISSAPLWTAVVGRLVGLERLGRLAWAGLGLALVGAGILVVGRSGFDLSSRHLLGNAVSFIGAICWGSYTALAREPLRHFSATALAFWTMVVALPGLWLLAFLEPQPTNWIRDTQVWAVIIYSGGLSTALAYVLWNIGIRRVGATHTAVFANLVPVIAMVIGISWLGETAEPIELFGAFLILLGLYATRVARRKLATAPTHR